jgi:hypothetical protein
METVRTTERVKINTAPEVNSEISEQIKWSLFKHSGKSHEEIDQRLKELEEEWDIERAIEANAGSVMLAGLALSTVVSRKWLVLPFTVSSFLLYHAVKGWCPPVPILRRLGFRTAHEIEEERTGLKLLRGDFELAKEESRRADVDKIYEAVSH